MQPHNTQRCRFLASRAASGEPAERAQPQAAVELLASFTACSKSSRPPAPYIY